MVGQELSDARLEGVFSTFTVNVPQLDADIDRVKAKEQGVPLQNLFETMQIYLAPFTSMTSTVLAARTKSSPRRTLLSRPCRGHPRLKTRNDRGPDGAAGRRGQGDRNPRPRPRHALQRLSRRRNQRRPRPRLQLRPGRGAHRESHATNKLPKGMNYEWTELTYQRILAGNTAVYVYPLCILLVFLVLAALYESFPPAAGHHPDCPDVPPFRDRRPSMQTSLSAVSTPTSRQSGASDRTDLQHHPCPRGRSQPIAINYQNGIFHPGRHHHDRCL